MFVVKYQNYKSCSKYHPELSCKLDRCEAAKTIGTAQNMNLYEAVKPDSPYLGNTNTAFISLYLDVRILFNRTQSQHG